MALQRQRTRDITRFVRGRPKNTARAYQGTLVKFLAWVNGEPDIKRTATHYRSPVDIEHYDTLALEYLNNGHDEYDFADDLRDFLREKAASAPKSLESYKAAIISWLAENHVYLPAEMTRRLKVGGKSLTRDRAPTIEELRHILNHSDLQLKAYLLALTSSGMRPGEGLGIEWSDIDLVTGKIHIRREIAKNGEPRDTFVSTEALEVLKQWQTYHPAYAEKIDSYTVPEEFTRDMNKVFPLSYNGLRDKYGRVLERCGLDEKDPTTGWLVLRLHVMRKFFRTRLPQGGASVDAVEQMLGHEGYCGGAYVRLTDEEIEAAYRGAESALWIFKEPPYNKEDLTRLEQENQALRGELAGIQRQLATMNAMQASIAGDPEALQELVDKRIKALVGEGES
jgi:integrase